MTHPLLRRPVAALPAIALALLAIAPAARADSTTSTNWSGYAVHRSGVRFRRASASWTEPAASCSSSTRTYSSFWVGLGGYRTDSDALEQIGTELDCRDGTSRTSAWYELVPAAAHAIRLTVEPGDRLTASVSVRGERVTLRLADLTRGTRFVATITDRTLDLTSAEWVAEAPSDCVGSRCTVLPLADFGTVAFTAARATTTTGVTASPEDSPWTTTKITLGSTFAEAARNGAEEETSVTATPSALSDALGAFEVTYSATRTTTSNPTPGGPPSTGPTDPGGPSSSIRRLPALRRG